MKRYTAVLGLLALAAAPGCISAIAQPSASGANSTPATHVETQAVGARAVPVWLTLTGQLKGSRETDLAANAVGRVVKTLVERGATVNAGQPLAVIDTRSAALNLAEARASAESAAASADNAKLTCERYKALADTGAISQFEYDRVSVQCRTSDLGVSAAKARAALAGQLVGDGVIRAPFAGSVAERFVDVGEFVRADTRVVTMVDLSALRLEFTIPEASVKAALPGAKVRFSVAGYPDRKFEGTLVILVLGSVAYKSLGLDFFPNTDIPVVVITTIQQGAAAQEIESDITDKIEGAVNTISGIDNLASPVIYSLVDDLANFIRRRLPRWQTKEETGEAELEEVMS